MTTPQLPDGFAPTYGVELLFQERPTIRKRPLLESLQKWCPSLVPLDGDPDSDVLAFIHQDQLVKYKDASIPAQFFMAVADPTAQSEALDPALQQSWGFPEARERVAGCKSTVLATDMMSSGLEYRTRLALFQNALAGVLEVVPCQAVVWTRSQQVIDPQAFVAAMRERPAPNPLEGAVNVRLFNVSGGGDKIMDTLGLAALGLPDVQCHFNGLDPSDLARFLYNLSAYLFDDGDVIADGHTVEGLIPRSKWRCQHEKALVPPARVVLDVNPGQPYAAGNRAKG